MIKHQVYIFSIRITVAASMLLGFKSDAVGFAKIASLSTACLQSISRWLEHLLGPVENPHG